jgi:N-succinyldiaminopimelate aminotransferase
MNPLLDRLQPYPFERLRQLFAGVTPNPAYRPISLGLGEPKHPTPEFIKQALAGALDGLAAYPATAGEPRLREAFAGWLKTRYGLEVDPRTQVLPVNGSREALFAFAQTVIDANQEPFVVCPNPFYQIYEGAALLAGGQPYYAPSDPARNFAVDWDSVPAEVWARTQLLFVCSPGNPTGAVMPLDEWRKVFELSDRHGFIVASDECYSEIYFTGEAPLGGMEAAARLGRGDFRNLVSFTSLSKRSNVPGMRSGFVAGEAVPAVSHLSRQRHEPCYAASQHRGLGRRTACGREPGALPPQVRGSHPPAGTCARRETARRGLLPVGRRE